jgi:hypothetical protein
MRRREFITLIGNAVAAWPCLAVAEERRLVAMLWPNASNTSAPVRGQNDEIDPQQT